MKRTNPDPLRRVLRRASQLTLAGLAAALTTRLPAAISNVIVWDSVRTTSQLAATLQTAPTSTTGMRLWWKCDSRANIGWDSTGNARHAKINGTAAGIPMLNPWGVSKTVASGFNTPISYLVGDTGYAANADRTYEFWVRNPGFNNAVIFSLLQSETGEARAGQPSDIKRLWVDAQGRLVMADRGDLTGLQIVTSAALTWDTDKWYQISILYDYTSGESHRVKVYRAERNVAFPSAPLLDYTSSSHTVSGYPTQWLAIGGHEASYQTAERDDTGLEGCAGFDGNGQLADLTPEMFGADGTDQLDDSGAWRRACATLAAYGQGTLTLAAGATYLVGKETIVDDGDADTPWYQHDPMGWIVGARAGKITINGNGATVKLNGGLHFGGYDPVTGTEADFTFTATQNSAFPHESLYRAHVSDIGDLLHIETCLDVEVTNLKLDGNLAAQVWGGKYGDKGYQGRQSGLYLRNNDNVLVQNSVSSSNNALDGIGVTNSGLDDTSPLQKVTIKNATCRYNGRQGLSYNCGNHLEIYDSDFSYTGQTLVGGKKNYPGAGIDIEPMGRYMKAGTILENCTFFNNRENGLLLTGATPCIIRDCTMWQVSSGRAVFVYGDTSYGDHDEDHFFIRCSIYGQVYNRLGRRLLFEDCSFIQANNAYYGGISGYADVYDRPAIETPSNAGAIMLDGCNFDISQNDGTGITESAWCYNTVFENCNVKHANWKSGITSGKVSVLNNSLVVNTTFRDSGFETHPSDTYYIDTGGTATKVGPKVKLEGMTPDSDHYVSWGSAGGTRPLAAQTIPMNISYGVLTPNAGTGETQVAGVAATYSVDKPFTNPADSGGRLFDGDIPDDWTTVCGINWVQDQTVTVDLHQTCSVRSVKVRMSKSQRPLRVEVSVGSGTTWTPIGLLRPIERDNATYPDTWYTLTVPAVVQGSQVKLMFINDGLWGWYINEVKVYGSAP